MFLSKLGVRAAQDVESHQKIHNFGKHFISCDKTANSSTRWTHTQSLTNGKYCWRRYVCLLAVYFRLNRK